MSSSETQGPSVGSGEKAGRKFSSTGERAPGYQLLPNYFQKLKRLVASGWAHKMLCITVPNRRTASPEFFSWVRTRQLLSRHTCRARSPSLCAQGKLFFPLSYPETKELPMSRKKRLGCYEQEQLNLPREYPVFDGSQCIVNNGKFKMWRRQESKKIAWQGKTTTLHENRAWIPVVSWSSYFWKSVFSFRPDSILKSDGYFISKLKVSWLPAFLWYMRQTSRHRDNSRRVRKHEKNSGDVFADWAQ